VYTGEEKAGLAQRKNEYYRELLNKLTPDDILPGAMTVLEKLKRRGIKVAIGSSSQNTPFILKKIGLADYFDAIADGNEIVNSKPHPEVFLLAASKLEIRAEDCVVIEDAAAGIDAALAAGMIAVGVASASTYASAQYKVKDLLNFNIDELINDLEVI
jgi:beta-phosphoglucomutase